MTATNTTTFSQAHADFSQAHAVPVWLKEARERNLKRFLALGLPDHRNEEWHYTPLTRLGEMNVVPAARSEAALPELYEALSDPQAVRLVFINGFFSLEHSSPLKQLDDLTLLPLESKVARNSPEAKQALTLDGTDAVTSLNAAFADTGIYIRLKANAQLERPIQIFQVLARHDNDAQPLVAPRVVFAAEAGSRAVLDEIWLSQDETACLTDATTDISLGENAALTHRHLQLESGASTALGTTRVTQARDSRFQSLHFTFGAGLLRHNLEVRLEGEGAETRLFGLYAVKPGRHADHHTRIDHLAPHTVSEQVYKGVLQDHGKSVFNGKVIVHKGAQQTNAAQLNKNLLLGAKAEANTKPELQILADDVKCAHGATVGQLSEEEVFYLQSRAIPRDTAVQMLVRGFAEDVLNRIEGQHLRQALGKILSEEFFRM